MNWHPRSKIKFGKKDENIIEFLLNSRGISSYNEFLNPPESVVHDPYLLGNIEEVANRILQAIKNNEKICVSADCDSDGVFSTAFMVRYLRKFTDNVYISYNQRSQGHGIENQLDHVEVGTNLVIILDSSTNSSEACQTLREKGVDVVILDHHDYENPNPHAIIVNPKLDDTYPNKHISGAGVVYKVIQVLDDTLGTGEVDDYIDLVACGMYADMMPVNVLENRYIIIQGMKNIRNTGLRAILSYNNIEPQSVNSQTIGFTISPLINGAARKDAIELGIDLLLSDDFDHCLELVAHMKALNEERRAEEKALYEKYLPKINTDDKILIAIDKEASKNYNGLIANKIAQEFKRPAIVMREHEGSLAGSFRSYGDFSMKDFLNSKQVRKLIKYALGHNAAGGIGLKASNYQEFVKLINEQLKDVAFSPKIEYDLEIEASQITTKMINEVEKFDYLTGADFPPATFLIKDLFVEDDVKVMGKNRDTIKIPCDGIDVIKFRVNENWGSEIGVLDTIDVVGQLKLNEWVKWNGDVIITNQIVAEEYRVK